MLWLAPRAPYPPHRGDQLRLLSLAQAAKKLGYTQDLWIASATEAERQMTRKLGIFERVDAAATRLPVNLSAAARAALGGKPLQMALYAPSSAQRKALAAFVGAEPLQTYRHLFVQLVRMIDWLPADLRSHAVLDAVDTLSRSFESQASAQPLLATLYRREARLIAPIEARALAEFRGVSVVSAADASAWPTGAKQNKPPNVVPTIVPNGVDTDRFSLKPETDPSKPPTFIFHGNLGYLPNQAAAQRLRTEIWPRVIAHTPSARLWIVGARPPRSMRSDRALNIEVHGDVSSMTEFLHQADAAIYPIEHGSGMQNKVLEALACGLPVITSAQVLERLELSPSPTALSAESPSDYANAAIGMIEKRADPRAAAQLQGFSVDARNAVLGRYSWKAAFERLEAL